MNPCSFENVEVNSWLLSQTETCNESYNITQLYFEGQVGAWVKTKLSSGQYSVSWNSIWSEEQSAESRWYVLLMCIVLLPVQCTNTIMQALFTKAYVYSVM